HLGGDRRQRLGQQRRPEHTSYFGPGMRGGVRRTDKKGDAAAAASGRDSRRGCPRPRWTTPAATSVRWITAALGTPRAGSRASSHVATSRVPIATPGRVRRRLKYASRIRARVTSRSGSATPNRGTAVPLLMRLCYAKPELSTRPSSPTRRILTAPP